MKTFNTKDFPLYISEYKDQFMEPKAIPTKSERCLIGKKAKIPGFFMSIDQYEDYKWEDQPSQYGFEDYYLIAQPNEKLGIVCISWTNL